MFNKKEKKIIEKDLGFIEDSFGMLCDMVAFEDHCDGSFLSTKNEEELLHKNWMRGIRTFHLNKIAKNCSGNNWCKLKHLCRVAKGLQESCSRHLSVGEIEEAKECIKHYGECYIKFLEIIDIKMDELNEEVISSA